eukprot:1457290-Rhodomonas_salina.1
MRPAFTIRNRGIGGRFWYSHWCSLVPFVPVARTPFRIQGETVTGTRVPRGPGRRNSYPGTP